MHETETLHRRADHRHFETGPGRQKIVDLCRTHGISDATFYNWRTKYGGMEVSDAKRLKDLGAENKRLKQMLADAMLENRAIKDALSKKW